MTDLPSPLTPAEADLRDFAFMPLDVLRLRDSEIAALSTGDEFRCAVLLWCAAWHQVPAGSLPDDDKVLAQLAGFGRVVKEWLKERDGALRNWIKCADGRLYHPVVAEKANEAWAGRVKYAEKKEAERARKAEERRLKKLAEELALSQQIPLDTSDLSAGQNETVQRTELGSPPENALKETVDSGQWTVDSGQLTSKTTSTPPAPDGSTSPSAVGALCIAMRAAGIQAQPADPRMIALADQGVQPETVTAACEEAKRAKPSERIPPGFVLAILERWAKEATSRNVAGAAQPRSTKPPGIAEQLEARKNRGTDRKIIDIN